MNEQEFKNRVDQRWGENRHKGRKWVGIILLVAGGLLLAKVSGAPIPAWLFSWPLFLIGIGLLSGIRHNFRGIGWLAPILIGVVFLIDRVYPEYNFKPYIWPVALIGVGLLFLFRPKRSHWRPEDGGGFRRQPMEPVTVSPDSPDGKKSCIPTVNDGNDIIDATAIFGGVKKNVISKNFRFGDVTTFMGGAEINLTQADINGKVMIDCFNMFGGTKLIVPADWDVQSDLFTIFGGIEDKRPPSSGVNPNKVLYLDGTCIFGGVEIKSY